MQSNGENGKCRLLEFFDRKGILSTLQCGERAKQTTIDRLLSLEATVMKAQANSDQVVSIFFDMEKTYDLTWRHGIVMDLNGARIKEKMFNFTQKFLKPRYFKVKVNEILSDTKIRTEGIPQELVHSPTFFILKINRNAIQMGG